MMLGGVQWWQDAHDEPLCHSGSMTIRLVLAVFVMVSGFAWAQGGDDSKPAVSNVPGAQYPRIHPDLRVTFRVNAPEAQKVQVKPGGDGLGKGPYDMVRDDSGVWTVTTPPAVPGFHYYFLLVDGFQCNDPGSQTYFGWNTETSGVEVPDKVDFYEPKEVTARRGASALVPLQDHGAVAAGTDLHAAGLRQEQLRSVTRSSIFSTGRARTKPVG